MQTSNLWINQSCRQYFNTSNWHFVLWWTCETLEWPVPYITDEGQIWSLEIIMKTVLAKCLIYKSILMVSKHNLTELKFLVDFNGELLWKVELVIAKGCALLIATIFKLAANKLQINPKHKITYLEIVQALSCQKLIYCWRESIAMSTNEMLQRGECHRRCL